MNDDNDEIQMTILTADAYTLANKFTEITLNEIFKNNIIDGRDMLYFFHVLSSTYLATVFINFREHFEIGDTLESFVPFDILKKDIEKLFYKNRNIKKSDYKKNLN